MEGDIPEYIADIINNPSYCVNKIMNGWFNSYLYLDDGIEVIIVDEMHRKKTTLKKTVIRVTEDGERSIYVFNWCNRVGN